MPTISTVLEAVALINQYSDVQSALTKLQASNIDIIAITLNTNQLASIDTRLATYAESEFLTRTGNIQQNFYDYLVNILTTRRDNLLAQLSNDYNITP